MTHFLVCQTAVREHSIRLSDFVPPSPNILCLQVRVKPLNYVSAAMRRRLREVRRLKIIQLHLQRRLEKRNEQLDTE